jgi:hypothetical protein
MRSWIRKRAYTNRNGYCGVSERRRMFCSFKVKGHTLPVSKLLIERHTLTFIAILHLYVLFKGIYGDIWTQWDVILWGQAKVSAPVPTIQHEILREGFRLDPLYIYLLRPYFYYFFTKSCPLIQNTRVLQVRCTGTRITRFDWPIDHLSWLLKSSRGQKFFRGSHKKCACKMHDKQLKNLNSS